MRKFRILVQVFKMQGSWKKWRTKDGLPPIGNRIRNAIRGLSWDFADAFDTSESGRGLKIVVPRCVRIP